MVKKLIPKISAHDLVDFQKRNEPALLLGGSIAAGILSVITAYQAGFQASAIVEGANQAASWYKTDQERAKQIKKQMYKDITPLLIEPILYSVLSIGLSIGSYNVLSQRFAALSAVYTFTEEAYRAYRTKTQEIVGAKKEAHIKESVRQEAINRDDIPEESQIVVTGAGDVLCKDLYSGRYFYSTAEKIQMAVNDLSYRLLGDDWVSLNDYYYLIGLDPVKLGDDIGWGVNKVDHGRIPITFSAVTTKDQRPCLVVEFLIYPEFT